MKVILRTDITNIGRQGDIKDVATGFARNYLLPKRLAMEATPGNLKLWEREKVKLAAEREQIIATAADLAKKIEASPVSITVKVGDNGKLFGSVTNATLAKSLETAGFTVERHGILLPAPIKETGEYTVDIRLHPEVIAKLKVTVIAEKGREDHHAEEAAAEPAEAPAQPAAQPTEN